MKIKLTFPHFAILRCLIYLSFSTKFFHTYVSTFGKVYWPYWYSIVQPLYRACFNELGYGKVNLPSSPHLKALNYGRDLKSQKSPTDSQTINKVSQSNIQPRHAFKAFVRKNSNTNIFIACIFIASLFYQSEYCFHILFSPSCLFCLFKMLQIISWKTRPLRMCTFLFQRNLYASDGSYFFLVCPFHIKHCAHIIYCLLSVYPCSNLEFSEMGHDALDIS